MAMHNIAVTIITDALTGEPTEYKVETDNRDQIAWELVRERKKWPQQIAAPTLFSVFMAWSALTRAGDLKGVKFEDFQPSVTYAEAELVKVNPTRRGTAAG